MGLRLLQGPYLGETYRDWGLYEDRSGRWVMAQCDRDGVETRDVLEPFHEPAPHENHDGSLEFQGLYQVRPVEKIVYMGRIIQDESVLPAHIRDLADAMMGRLKQRFPSAVSWLMDPTDEQLARRRQITIERLNSPDFGERLRPIIGSLGDWSLGAYGIKYHSHTCQHRDDVYFLAHNDSEICGLLRLSGQEWGYGVRYINVCPGFRGRGLSKKLYQEALNLCAQEKKALLRTSPGEQTPPEATMAYDKMVKASPVLHATQGTPFAYLLQRVLEKGWDYDYLVEHLKPLCDKVIPSKSYRLQGKTEAKWEDMESLKNTYGATLDRLMKGPPSVPIARGPRP